MILDIIYSSVRVHTQCSINHDIQGLNYWMWRHSHSDLSLSFPYKSEYFCDRYKQGQSTAFGSCNLQLPVHSNLQCTVTYCSLKSLLTCTLFSSFLLIKMNISTSDNFSYNNHNLIILLCTTQICNSPTSELSSFTQTFL